MKAYVALLGTALRDRMYLIALIVLIALSAGLVISTALQLQPSELQLPNRYTSFGITNFYRDKWYYLISFAVFGLVVLLIHVLLSLKLYARKGRELGVTMLWLGVAVVGIGYFMILALLQVVALSQ